MKKYSKQKNASDSQNTQKKPNIFERYKELRTRENSLKRYISDLEKDLKKAEHAPSPYYSEAKIAIIKEKLYDRMRQLNKVKESHSHLKRRIALIATALGMTLTITTASIASYANDRANKNFDNNIESAYSMLQEDENNRPSTQNDSYSDLLYEQLKVDVSRYVELTKQESLDDVEKEELDNVKSRIKANPQGVTELSLDILKQKIATSLGIDDYTRLNVYDSSSKESIDKYTSRSGYNKNISILLDGKLTIASVESFQSLANGDISSETDTIPKEVLDCIVKIVNAQKSKQDFKDANKALKSALGLDENIEFSKEVKDKVGNIESTKQDKQVDER